MESNDLMQKIASVLDKQDVARDQLVESSAPSGRYSKMRLDLITDAVNSVLALIGAPYVVEKPVITDPSRPFTLPVDLVKGLTLIKNMLMDYNEEAMETIPEFEIVGLKSDADLALALRSIKTMIASKAFNKWLKAERAEGEVVAPEAPIEEPQSTTQSNNIDLMLLKK